MTLKPCLQCGEPSSKSRCPAHRPPHRAKTSATSRGYDHAWTQLSRRARHLQGWCTDCGATTDLQADHLPIAWKRREAGLPIRLKDIVVRCGSCNRAQGAARGATPNDRSQTLRAKAESALHTDGLSP